MKIGYQSAAMALIGIVACSTALAQSAADNTKMNKPAMNSMSSTSVADGQSNSKPDIALTAKIRKSVMADKNLSTYAHNVKIVTVNGAVTLNGVVRSEQEKTRVNAKAESIAGKGNVTNDLTVQGS